MKFYVGFDDTDVLGSEIGTGKLVRSLEQKLPAGARMWGVVRHQLLVDERIPATSHNSSACAIVDADGAGLLDAIRNAAIKHIEEAALEGSDPGLCIARVDAVPRTVVEFGLSCTHSIETQKQAMRTANDGLIHLSGHGGTNDGIIGALAAVGLTAHGWSGRLIERGGLRNLPDPVPVSELLANEITPIDIGRDSVNVPPDALIYTSGWPRPRFCGGRAVLPIRLHEGRWISLGAKRDKTRPVETK
ncbi:MAG TPA: hypothetical protein VD837_00370 [Terriglobales bacterium]|nr:hypothetical protein [Terriglobales bacterium]